MTSLEFTEGPEFIEDGHKISFVLDSDKINVHEISCPNIGSTSLCNRRRTFCVVERFIDAYGIDLCLGKVLIDGPIEIAWCPVHGDESDLDDEFDCVWYVPVNDPDYRLMLADRAEAAAAIGMSSDLPAIEAPREIEEGEDESS